VFRLNCALDGVMSSAPVRGIVPHRQRRHNYHHIKHQRCYNNVHNKDNVNRISIIQSINKKIANNKLKKKEEIHRKRPKVNPIFLWAAQCEQRIIEVRCEDYDKRNRIKLTKTAQGWRSIPCTVLTAHPIKGSIKEDEIGQNVLATTKNKEKENTSREQFKIKQIQDNDDTKINSDSKLDENREEKVIHKRKRKSYDEISKNKETKISLETEEYSITETLISQNWKMKKRRKLDKNKKRKKLCMKKTVDHKNKNENQNELKIKTESNSKEEKIEQIKKTEINIKEANKYQNYISNSKQVVTLINDNIIYNDLEKLQNNRHFQPRVVLEQLHLSQFTTRNHCRPMSKMESANNYKLNARNRENNIDKIALDNVKKNNQNTNESRTVSKNEEVILNKEDWLDMLNILDPDLPNKAYENNSCLIDSRKLTKSSKNFDTSILLTNQINDSKLNLLPKKCAKNEFDSRTKEKKKKIVQRGNIKHHIGSKSLDKTIERLERSINNQKKINSISNNFIISECNLNKPKINKEKYTSYRATNEQNIINFCNSTSTSLTNKIQEISTEKDILESSQILNVLRKTPNLSVSLPANGRKCTNFINRISTRSKFLSSNPVPDSQTKIVERIGKSIPELSIIIPTYRNKSKHIFPISTNRVDSTENMVNVLKHELCNSKNTHEIDEKKDSNSVITEKIKDKNNDKRQRMKCTFKNEENFQYLYDNESKISSVDSSKVQNLKSQVQFFYKNSEAQLKYLDLCQLKEINNFDKQVSKESNLQVLPQPKRKPYLMTTSSRSSSAYLEQILPNPLCSVSYSEDANNDLILKDILSTPNYIDSKNAIEEEQTTDLRSYCECSLPYNIFDDAYLKELSITDQIIVDQKSQSLIPTDVIKYLEMTNHLKSISNSHVQNQFVKDCYSDKCPLSTKWTTYQHRIHNNSYKEYLSNHIRYLNQQEFLSKTKLQEMYISSNIFLDPASQLRELIKTSGHLIPDPLLVPRDYLPLVAGAPLIEIPKLLTTRPELRLPEALTKPELLRDPDLLVISLAHLQYVLDYGERSIGKIHQSKFMLINSVNETTNIGKVLEKQCEQQRPKLSCKPIDKLMPVPINLSSNHKLNSCASLLRIRNSLLNQEANLSSTANSSDDLQLWHPLFGR
jgi:hypothetical protein